MGDENVVIDNAPSLGYVVREMWAYLAVDQEGEGLAAVSVPGRGFMPLVGADKERMLSLRPQAVTLAQLTGKNVRLVRFTTREVVEEITP